MGRTPDRSPWSPAFENEIILEDRTADGDPTSLGGIRLINGEIRGLDALGVYNFRGVSEADHDALDTLTHEIEETSFDEAQYAGRRLVNYTTYTDVTKTTKIREYQITYAFGNRISQIAAIQYDATGIENERVTLDLNYTGRLLTSVIRTHSP